MRLFCREREVEPILPAKVARFDLANDARIEGIYAYPPKAISADCGAVKLEIVSAGNPHKVRMKDLEPKLIARVDEDFSPYDQKYGSPPFAVKVP